MPEGRSSAGGSSRITISMPSGIQKDIVHSVVAYESKVRGCSKGQACFELVMEAAGVSSYPPQLRERLEELALESDAYAVARALRLSAGGGEGEEAC